jgi:hypothetical protein
VIAIVEKMSPRVLEAKLAVYLVRPALAARETLVAS